MPPELEEDILYVRLGEFDDGEIFFIQQLEDGEVTDMVQIDRKVAIESGR